jgi:zinc transport system substrate-binding protein
MSHPFPVCALVIGFILPSAVSAFADEARYRALIADHANGKLTLLDAVSGKIIANYGVEGPARLKPSDNGKMIYAAQGTQNRVDVIESGITVTSHGDHADVDAKAPRMTSVNLTGTKPSHINVGNGRVAAFFDGEGLARVVREDALLSGKAKVEAVKTARPHHGLAAPVGDFLAVSIPHPGDSKELPIGIELLDRSGKSLAKSTDCPRMHGEARFGMTSAFGCADGVLLLTINRAGGKFEKIAYPSALPPDRMVRNLATGQAVNSFLGDFGVDGMVVLDPTAKDFKFIQLPSRRMHFARERVMGNLGFAITEEGQVHKINALTGTIESSLQVTDRYAMDGGSAVPRPRLSASGDRLVVTDPAKATVHVIDTVKMQVVHKVAVPGSPFDPVLVGASGGDH